MTFSPQLEERFAKMLHALSGRAHALGRGSDADVRAGRSRRDHPGTDRRSRQALRSDAAAGGRSGGLLLDAAPQAAGQVSTCRCAPTSVACWWAARNCTSTPSKKLGIGHKETTADGQFSLEEVECMGACSWAPAVEINYDFHHHVTPEKLDQLDRRPEEGAVMAEASFTTNRARSKPASSASASRLEGSETLDVYLANDGFKAFLQSQGDDARGDHRGSEDFGSARPRRRGIPDRPEVELRSAHFAQAASTSSSTPTKASPAPAKTGC